MIDGRFEIMGYCESARLEEALDLAIKALEQPERKKGEWIYYRETGYGNPYGHFECSLCGDGYGYKANFCPNCGADMRGGE